MNRSYVAGAALLAACGIAFVALSLAQRDSRSRFMDTYGPPPAYADQSVEPIAIDAKPGFQQSLEDQGNFSLPPSIDPPVSTAVPIRGANNSATAFEPTFVSHSKKLVDDNNADDNEESERIELLASDVSSAEEDVLDADANTRSASLSDGSAEAPSNQIDDSQVVLASNNEPVLRQPPAANATKSIQSTTAAQSNAFMTPPGAAVSKSAADKTSHGIEPLLSAPPSLSTPPVNPTVSPTRNPTTTLPGPAGSLDSAPPSLSAPLPKNSSSPSFQSPPNLSQIQPGGISTNGSTVPTATGSVPPINPLHTTLAPLQNRDSNANSSSIESVNPPTYNNPKTAAGANAARTSWPNSGVPTSSTSSLHQATVNTDASLRNTAPNNSRPTFQDPKFSENENLNPQYGGNNRSDAFRLASSAPGKRQLDGSQTPSLQILKRAPEEVQVGQPAMFSVLVRNVGNSTAYDVKVTDSVPRGTSLTKTNPPAEATRDGQLIWSLGEMTAGSEQVLSVELVPETEGEIGSVASVTFASQASVRTVSTQPKLVVHQTASTKVLLGQPIDIQITVSNEGTGIAKAVSLEADIPSGLRHPLGPTLGVPLGDLVPGQSQTTHLELIGSEAGEVKNVMRAVSSNAAAAESETNVQVVAPELKVAVGGPKLRYLERQATYQVTLTNNGTAIARDIELVAYLPRGMQFNSAINNGDYLTDQHAVSWGLEELAIGATATTEMCLLPVEEGEYVIRMQSRATGVRSDPFEKTVKIEGQSELAFTIEDDNDPVETDGETTYTIKLSNTGTRVDNDVVLFVELPAGAKVMQVNAPVAYQVTREGIMFDAIAQMSARDQHTFRLNASLMNEGVQVIRAHVKSKLRPQPVIKEESTQVYRDE